MVFIEFANIFYSEYFIAKSLIDDGIFTYIPYSWDAVILVKLCQYKLQCSPSVSQYQNCAHSMTASVKNGWNFKISYSLPLLFITHLHNLLQKDFFFQKCFHHIEKWVSVFAPNPKQNVWNSELNCIYQQFGKYFIANIWKSIKMFTFIENPHKFEPDCKQFFFTYLNIQFCDDVSW